MKAQVNVGLIGYKFMGKAHSHAFLDEPFFFKTGCVPVRKVICGRTEHLVKQAAEAFGWEEYATDWREVVARPDVDLVDIATPSDSHRDIAVAAAEAGKAIFCEKPMALSLAHAREMLAAAEQAGVPHMIGFNYRRVPAIGLAKRMIADGRLGELYHWRATYLQDWIVDPQFPVMWKLQRAVAGSGPHGDLNAHLIDLAHYLVGDLERVVGQSKTFIKYRPRPAAAAQLSTMLTAEGGEGLAEVDVEDCASFLAVFKNGATGTFEATRLATGRKNYERFEVNGSKGSLVFNFERMNELEYYSRGDRADEQGWRTIMATDESHPYISAWWPPGHLIGYEQTFVNQFADLMRNLAEGSEPSPNFTDGVKCQQVLEAVQRSVEQNRWVTVDEL